MSLNELFLNFGFRRWVDFWLSPMPGSVPGHCRRIASFSRTRSQIRPSTHLQVRILSTAHQLGWFFPLRPLGGPPALVQLAKRARSDACALAKRARGEWVDGADLGHFWKTSGRIAALFGLPQWLGPQHARLPSMVRLGTRRFAQSHPPEPEDRFREVVEDACRRCAPARA